MLDRVIAHGLNEDLRKPPQPPPQTHRIRLEKDEAYSRVVTGGLEDARRAVGEAYVKFDKTSKPPAIIVTGNNAILRHVQAALFPDRPLKKVKTITCDICYEEVEIQDRVAIPGCNHMCCSTCFANHCTVDIAAKLPLTCFGCDRPMPMDFLVAQLDHKDFMRLAREVVITHMSGKSDQYGQCPGVDCSALFKVSAVTGEKNYRCPSCFTVSCFDCKVEHTSDETCAGYKERASEKGLEEWMKESNAKKCRCGAVIEKDGGCNHMVCRSCQAHICYQCGKEFGRDEIYDHMRNEHGTYGDEDAEEDVRAIDDAHAQAAAAMWGM
jgi:hypothetical protein